MTEKQLQRYIVRNNDEFIKRYLNEIMCLEDAGYNAKIEFIGAEVKTGNGNKRADLIYRIDTLYPMIIVIELKQNVDTRAIAQVCSYIKDLKKSRKFEKNDTKQYLLGAVYHYYGIVAGKSISGTAQEIIDNDVSYSLSYIDFSKNMFKKINEDNGRYYTNNSYWFECKMY